jgi:ABC-2 type transport system ATP-binding protein
MENQIKSKTNTEPILKVENIEKGFGSVKAVDKISFNVYPGEVFGLLGPNGAGKTTTIKMILGLLEPDEGKVELLGLDPQKNDVEIKQNVGYVAEEPMIFKSLTPKELFNFIASIRQLKGEKASKQLAEYLQSLDALPYYNKIISTLSHGNKQKIQIIAALLHSPKLLIMDEPLTGLDAKSVRVLKEIMQMHVERGGAIIFSTHIMEIAEELCDRIAIINKGKMVGIGTLEELRLKTDGTENSLEQIFLNLTEEDHAVKDIIENLRKNMNQEV